ncbi:Malate/lactate/ureidoglycolate dehydrogenase, LDH2 family [Modicisalibacter muralis]|uniref:Malate/lactate/ureidoglycolate dehydrogenase, LDH2 family n=1 Tax=Modicisalibacter muralis TaxID=119000 RepID=A0A1G9KNQ4_9GAMM|nr:Ldh family oxidoreductase [Halomonas muralis]SDL51144.1 Malate/lactate/ureidoglycolate dehydrogenase, LDH2 family [Halomonas muralis]
MSDRRQARIAADALQDVCQAALCSVGLAPAYAAIVAETLVEADLLGHSTHGAALLPRYLKELEEGRMARDGEPAVIKDTAASAAWDGHYLPGPVLVRRALDQASERAVRYGIATVAIGRSHHIACLAAYLKRITDRGLIAVIASSSPATRSVAPFGAVEGVYSPDPIAAGYPTEGDPVLIDVSMSITTNSLTSQLASAGEKLAHPWLIDADGNPSDDPSLIGDGCGALLPMGGFDHGHKGFALGLLVEALTSGLAGLGRADEPTRWGASVLVMVIDPKSHGGIESLKRETGFLADACRAASVATGKPAVRLPGERALALRQEQRENGVLLSHAALEKLEGCIAPDAWAKAGIVSSET